MKNIRERDELKDDSAEFLMSVSEPGFQHWCGERPLPDAPLSTHPKFSERCRCFGQNTAALVTPRHTGHGLGASLPKGSALLGNKIYTTRQLPQGVQNTFASGIFLRMSHVVPQQQIFTTSNWQVWILGCCRYHPETAQHCHHWVPSTSGELG